MFDVNGVYTFHADEADHLSELLRSIFTPGQDEVMDDLIKALEEADTIIIDEIEEL